MTEHNSTGPGGCTSALEKYMNTGFVSCALRLPFCPVHVKQLVQAKTIQPMCIPWVVCMCSEIVKNLRCFPNDLLSIYLTCIPKQYLEYTEV
jgi:hypothetical protein